MDLVASAGKPLPFPAGASASAVVDRCDFRMRHFLGLIDGLRALGCPSISVWVSGAQLTERIERAWRSKLEAKNVTVRLGTQTANPAGLVRQIMAPWFAFRPAAREPNLDCDGIRWGRAGDGLCLVSPPISRTAVIDLKDIELVVFPDSCFADHMSVLASVVLTQLKGLVKVLMVPEVVREIKRGGETTSFRQALLTACETLGERYQEPPVSLPYSTMKQWTSHGQKQVPLSGDRLIVRQIARAAFDMNASDPDRPRIFLVMSLDLGFQYQMTCLDTGNLDFRIPALSGKSSLPRLSILGDQRSTTVSSLVSLIYHVLTPSVSLVDG